MRVFERGDLIPDDVEAVECTDGIKYVRHANGLFGDVASDDQPGFLSANTSKLGPEPLCAGWFDYEFPLMEVPV